MPDRLESMKLHLLEGERRLLDDLVNRLLIVMVSLSTLMILLVNLRALQIGHSLRDVVQILLYLMILYAALRRRSLSVSTKLFTVIAAAMLAGIAGILSLGYFGGAVFYMPSALVVAALFLSRPAVAAISIGAVMVMVFAGLLFTLGKVQVADPAGLMQNPLNWVLYISAFTVFVTFTGMSVFQYRNTLRQLMAQVSKQRDELATQQVALEKAMAEIKTLQGIIPICSYCHNIRDDSGAWDQLEKYISQHSTAKFSHGVCPSCLVKLQQDPDF